MAELPTGTITFLFTDIEGSTRLWEEHPEAMRAALACHDAVLFYEEHQHIISAGSSQPASGTARPISRWQTGA